MWIFYILKQRSILWVLLLINILGTIYGYYWYRYQLDDTPWYFLPFVPDSPTASLFFVFVLIGFLLGRNFPLIEALAAITLFKYGIWAVGMNIGGIVATGQITIENWMLIFSHLGMAIQGLLYAPFYRITFIHFFIATLWTFHNDVIDYVFLMFPRYPSLDEYMPFIGYLTFWLSVLTCYLVYHVAVKKERLILDL
ncbi:DUF1405 domain-containing protein [Pueribacillus theae]|uniref:DUF1405 domain-containing protein n=1 Tax=Pueribacillus theae TaxID=2171751 RepID=A0A2U1K4M8_9BACI|nr:DUF1405 domain-containing protein [Pueribacillus theae]PWA12352.1 DUF1405 domain-containing protein [Pueribacillus theae]